MTSIPLAVLDEHVWPRVHELQLLPTLQLVAAIGPSCIEDLPDLLRAYAGWRDKPELPGWSTRVSEALGRALFFATKLHQGNTEPTQHECHSTQAGANRQAAL